MTIFVHVGAMTVVIAVSREEVPGERRNYDTGNRSLCSEDWNYILNSFFEDVSRRSNNFTAEMESSIAPESIFFVR